MKFTGERVIPGEVDADLFNEHWTRYLFASRFAAGKKVLDVACGSGYGTALLAENAASVAGADIAREAVEYARRHYGSPNTQFIQADCFSLPFGAQFDLVVAFEIIEHLQDAARFLTELRRVLTPAGVLLISTPNRLYYTDDRGEVNPFHEREYSHSEFGDLLRSVFSHCSILLQNHVAGVLIADASGSSQPPDKPMECLQPPAVEPAAEARRREREAYFLVAVCSAQPLPAAPSLLYLPSTGNVLRERETHIRELENQLAVACQERDTARERFRSLEKEFEAEVRRLDEEIRRLQKEFAERSLWAEQLNQTVAKKDAFIVGLQNDYARQLEAARAALLKLQQEFEERTAWALRLNRDLQFLQGSRWYRIGRKLRMDLDPPASPSDGKS